VQFGGAVREASTTSKRKARLAHKGQSPRALLTGPASHSHFFPMAATDASSRSDPSAASAVGGPGSQVGSPGGNGDRGTRRAGGTASRDSHSGPPAGRAPRSRPRLARWRSSAEQIEPELGLDLRDLLDQPRFHHVGIFGIVRFQANEVRLWLSVIAYNLGNLWRRLGLPKSIDTWSLTSLQQRLIRTGGRLVKHARYYWLLLAEGHLTRTLFCAIPRRQTALSVAAG
jgi:hypothetical protein